MSLLKRCMINCPLTITLFFYVIGYYLYLLQLPSSSTTTLIISVLFHTFFFLSFISLVFAFFLSPGTPPANFSPDSLPEDAKVPYNSDFSEIDFSLARISYCKKCEIYRPPRSHHCSICDKCVLRYEHHCPFVGNCVGFRNQKPFILFLLYSSCALLLLLVEGSIYLTDNFSYWALGGFIANLAVFIFLAGFTLSQINLLAQNLTTLECSWSHGVFDTGSPRKNIEQVLGDNPLMWFVPCCQHKGGLNYPVRMRLKSVGYLLIENQFLI